MPSTVSMLPKSAQDFERLGVEVEIKLRHAMVAEGSDRLAQLLVQFGLLLLTKGQMSVQQFGVFKTTVADLANPKGACACMVGG